MICGNCRVAGYINEEANEQPNEADPEKARAMALKWHGKCRDRCCTCQHQVGDVIDPLAVSRETRRTVHAALNDRFRRFLGNA